MIYKGPQNPRLPMLGFDGIWLPLLPGSEDSDVGGTAMTEVIVPAMERGANYLDTVYDYHNDNSKWVMSRILSHYPRESWLLASKLPGCDMSNARPDRVGAIFKEQLEKYGVDYFGFYLFHNVYKRNAGPYLDPDNHVLGYLLCQKEAGRIRHLGSFTHGSSTVIQRFLDAYGECMEFGQLQLNYLDQDFRGIKAKAKELSRHRIPVWAMGSLQDGRLARLSDRDAACLTVLQSGKSMPGQAFRFLQGMPGVTMVFPGTSDLEQLRANLDAPEADRPLSETRKAALLDVVAGMVREQVLPCTTYHHYVDHCPRHLDIPGLLTFYSERTFIGGGSIAPMAVGILPEGKQPATCISYRSCEVVCPQQLKIPEALANFVRELE